MVKPERSSQRVSDVRVNIQALLPSPKPLEQWRSRFAGQDIAQIVGLHTDVVTLKTN